MQGAEKLIRSAGRAYRTVQEWEPDPNREFEDGQMLIESNHQCGVWADVETDSGLTISEIAQLVFRLKDAEYERGALSRSQEEAESFYRRIMEAREIMRTTDAGSHKERMSRTLFHLGLIGDDHGKGSRRRHYDRISRHYHALRYGDRWWNGEEFRNLEPHSYEAAMLVIHDRYGIEWDALQKGCRRNDIESPQKQGDFPIP